MESERARGFEGGGGGEGILESFDCVCLDNWVFAAEGVGIEEERSSGGDSTC